jgi:hypothetical protein
MPDSFFDSLLNAITDFLIDANDGADELLISGRLSTEEYEVFSGKRATPAPDSGPVGFGRIRQRDPKFDVAEFLKRVGEMFLAYHGAKDKGDLAPVRRFIDEESWAELNRGVQTVGRREYGVRDFRITAIRPMTATHEFGLDTIRVLINAQITNDDDPPLCEYWELIRKEDALTHPGLDLTHCPHCGAPIDGDDPTRCAYCGERLADPAFDWVVRKIAEQ